MIESCSDNVLILAGVGVIAIYFLLAFLVYSIIKAIEMGLNDRQKAILALVFPVSIILGILWVLGRWIFFPFIGATRADLREVEQRIMEKLPEKKAEPLSVSVPKNEWNIYPGSFITAKDVQTDKHGNDAGYTHLGKGAVCRVLGIDEKGSMQVVLIDHANLSAHTDQIGQTFTVPARNFVPVQKSTSPQPVKRKGRGRPRKAR